MKTKIIFFGNGALADTSLSVLKNYSSLEIIFHAKSKSDLDRVKILKKENPSAVGVLASFGVLIKKNLLDLFEPLGILNIHPSLLPKYRGASPIESAILAGDSTFSVSVMKLVQAMDAGPIFCQKTFEHLPLDKAKIYETLASAGATWLAENLPTLSSLKNVFDFPNLIIQSDSAATFTKKFKKSDGVLTPETDPADLTFRKIIAFQTFPKPKLPILGQECIILSARPISHSELPSEASPLKTSSSPESSSYVLASKKRLFLRCADGNYLELLRLQPASRKPMDATSFLNGLK